MALLRPNKRGSQPAIPANPLPPPGPADYTGPDWASRHFPYWENLFSMLDMGNDKPLRFLEIGCCEGRSTRWFLENVLGHPDSTIHVIDTFDGSPEFAAYAPQLDIAGMRERFVRNVEPWSEKVDMWDCDSYRALAYMYGNESAFFDFAYLDGSHAPADVLADAVLAWHMLKPAGVMLFDDATWTHTMPDGKVLRPRVGINAFLTAHADQYDQLYSNTQIAIVKRT